MGPCTKFPRHQMLHALPVQPAPLASLQMGCLSPTHAVLPSELPAFTRAAGPSLTCCDIVSKGVPAWLYVLCPHIPAPGGVGRPKPTLCLGVMSMGWSAQVGRLGPCFSVAWMKSCPPQSFSRGSLSPNGLVLGRVAGTWVLGVSSPAGLVLLRAEAERALLTWGHSRGGCAGREHGPQPCQKLTLVAASQPPDCDSNVCCLSPQPGEL